MQEHVDADNASVPAASAGGDTSQQPEIVFTAATVPAVAKLGHHGGKRGTRSEESRIARR